MTGGSYTELRQFVVALVFGALALVGGCSTSETTGTETPPAKVTTAPVAEAASASGGVGQASAGAEPPAQPADPDPATLATCQDVEGAYGRLVSNRSCASDSDCQVLAGSCGVGLGGCAEAVNASVTPAQLDALAARWSALGCTAGVCRCREPGLPKCQNGRCEEQARTP